MNHRTCLVSGKALEVNKLLRFTIVEDVLTFDRDQKANGRGGYVERETNVLAKLPKLKDRVKHFMGHKGPLDIPVAELEWATGQC